MRFRQLPIALILSLLLALRVAYAADPPKEFRGFRWGVAPATTLKLLSGPTTDGTTVYVPTPGKSLADFLGVSVAEEAYTFSRGRFFSGSVWLNGRPNFEKMKVELNRAYGTPAFTNERTELYKWKWPGAGIEVHLYYQAKFGRTTVTYINNAI